MKITAPATLGPITGPMVAGDYASVVFVDGVHHTDDEHIANHFEGAGWDVNRAKLTKEHREWDRQAAAAGFYVVEGADPIELDPEVANDRGIVPTDADLNGDPDPAADLDQPANAQE